LAARRDLGSDSGACADALRCRGRGGLGDQRGQLDRPRPSACQWRPSSAESGRRKKGLHHLADEGLGRSRGGLTTKFHLACDGKGRPLSIVIHPATDMTARNWRRSWTAFVGLAPVGVGGRGRVPIASSPTKATAIHTVVGCCASARSRIPYLSAEINGRVARSERVVRWSLRRRSTRVATWWSAASIASSSGVGWRRAMRSALPTTGRWPLSPPLSSGSTRDSSANPGALFLIGSTHPPVISVPRSLNPPEECVHMCQ